MIVLGIETSCDETSVALVENGKKILSNVIYSSLKQHQPYGGVIPEIASRAHSDTILPSVKQALKLARCRLSDVDAVAVTNGPGLLGSILVGVSAAKTLALALKKPLIGVNHVVAHATAARLYDKKLAYPFLALVVSGGHTLLLAMKSAVSYRVLGRTLDDAAGEAFDKVAKILGLGYPGGPVVDRLSRGEDTKRFFFNRPYLSKDSLDFSFSGIKTAVLYRTEELKKKGPLSSKTKKLICAGFQESLCDVLVEKSVRAAKDNSLKTVVVGGGVSANSRLREKLTARAKKEGLRAVFPPLVLCQDNAAMIAAQGYEQWRMKQRDGLDLAAYPNFKN